MTLTCSGGVHIRRRCRLQYTAFCTRYSRAGNWRSMRQTHRAGKLFAIMPADDADHRGRYRRDPTRQHFSPCSAPNTPCLYHPRGKAHRWPRWSGAAFIGGVPELIVRTTAPWSPWPAATNRNSTAPRRNSHYTDGDPAGAQKTADKAKVEVGVQVVERWIMARLRHRQF